MNSSNSSQSSTSPKYSIRPYRPVQLDGLTRLGRDHDGGYVVLRDLIDRCDVLLSLGVNVDWSFEEAVVAMHPAIRVTCVDGTTGIKRALIKSSQKAVDMLGHFLSFQINRARRDAKFLTLPLEFHRFFSKHELLRLMVAKESVPGSITLPKLIDRVTDGGKDCWVLIKMDIEGAEFEVLPLPAGGMDQVAMLIVEFHRIDLHWDRFQKCMSDLMAAFHIAHIHGNNFDGYIPHSQVPATLELTFVNKRLVADVPPSSVGSYPITGLDMPCSWKRPELRINFD